MSNTAKEYPIPSRFDAKKTDQVWRVSYQEVAEEAKAWAKKHGVQHVAKDKIKICLLPIDTQNTFCIPGFELFVGGRSGNGAIEDNIRLCEFIYRNLGSISEISPTLDTHTAMQIFHIPFWIDKNGNHPAPATVITADEVEKEIWMVNPAVAHSVMGDSKKFWYLKQHGLHYVKKLAGGRYPLMVWPFHAMLGGIGHALVSSVEEALFFHNIARSSQTDFQIKGGNPLTENYSVLRPEVLEGPDGRAIAQKNADFIKKLLSFDVVIIAGQAMSHCVAWTIDDLLNEIMVQDPLLVKKIYLMKDCTSPVVIPGVIDFTDQAEEAFKRFADAGMHVVKSTDPIETWPDISL